MSFTISNLSGTTVVVDGALRGPAGTFQSVLPYVIALG